MATTEYIDVINEQALASFQDPPEPDTTPISMGTEEQMERHYFQAAQRLDTLSTDIHELKTALEKATQCTPSVTSVQIFSLPAAEYDLNQPITVILKIYADEVV